MAIDCIISYDLGALETVTINDATTPVPSSVNGVRILFSTVNSRADIATDVDTLEAWYEYEVVSGSTTINGTTYSTGDLILLANDTTPTGTFQIDETGRYGQYISDVLPTSPDGWSFTPTQTGRQPLDSSYFADEIFTIDYEQYTTIYNAGDTLVSGVYLVVGTEGATVVVGGSRTYYVGEVFESNGSETFTGTPTCVKYDSEGQFSFATKYESNQVWGNYLGAKAQAVNPDEQLDGNLLSVASLLGGVEQAELTDQGIGLVNLQNGLDQINDYYSEQL